MAVVKSFNVKVESTSEARQRVAEGVTEAMSAPSNTQPVLLASLTAQEADAHAAEFMEANARYWRRQALRIQNALPAHEKHLTNYTFIADCKLKAELFEGSAKDLREGLHHREENRR